SRSVNRTSGVEAVPERVRGPDRKESRSKARSLEPHQIVNGDDPRTAQTERHDFRGRMIKVVVGKAVRRSNANQRFYRLGFTAEIRLVNALVAYQGFAMMRLAQQ